MVAPSPSQALAAAAQARREGRFAEAVALLRRAATQQPGHGPTLNSLGLTLLEAGDVASAIESLRQAAAADPNAPPVWLNLAEAYRRAGRAVDEIGSLDRALAIDPYLLPALLRKAQAFERLGRRDEAALTYRALLAASPDASGLPEPIRQALAHGREVVRAYDERRAAVFETPLEKLMAGRPGEDFRRARAYADHAAGRRKVYHPEPTGNHFPFLPALEYFDRADFPWFETLERATEDIKRELLSVWQDGEAGFAPYVAFKPTEPVNQWDELNHSPRWSAWFFYKDGVRQEENCARCPLTAALLARLPLLDLPGKAPSVMFSILAPRTRIPPHTGSSNVRVTVHLPLVVPPGCGFRVGGDTREWREGEAWAFDDTIEHEAWNDSDQPRAILILDAWNPFLTEAERAAVRLIG